MEDDIAKVTAKYEAGLLSVTENDHILRPPLERQELTPYLQFLSEQGWVARRASFEGYVVGVELVKSDLAETQVSYCKQETQLSSFAFNKDFMNELKQPMLKYGWRELVSSKIIAHVHGSLLVISLWMKLIPKMPPVT